jgi:periplasmic copper chaperone A
MRRTLSTLMASSLALLVIAAPLAAHDYTLGDLVIAHPWTRATPPGAPVAGGYLAITNKGGAADRLVAVSFAGASNVEIHEMKMDGDVMKMAELPGGLVIEPGATVRLEPGGFHLMLMGLSAQLTKGQTIKGALTFDKAGTIAVEFAVEALGAKAPAGSADEHATH